MLLLAFRHGLRASELCGLQWSDVEFASGTLHLRRAKGGQTQLASRAAQSSVEPGAA